jgi:hypothetical protein
VRFDQRYIAFFLELTALRDSADKADLVPVFVSRASEETGQECFLVLLQRWLAQWRVPLGKVGE